MARSLRWFLAAVLVAHLPLWSLRTLLYVQTPLFNYDFMLAVAAMAIVPWLGAFLLGLGYALTWLIVCAHVYRFKSWSHLFDNVMVVSAIDWTSFLSVGNLASFAAFGVGLLGALYCAVKSQATVFRSTVMALSLIGVTMTMDALNGSTEQFFRANRRIAANIASSGAYIVQKDYRLHAQHDSGLAQLPWQESVLGRADLLDHATRFSAQSMVMLAVESMGLPIDAELRAWLQRQVRPTHYAVSAFEVPFKGATTNATLRALCALDGHYASVNFDNVSNCHPRRLQALGWRTVGYHGFTGAMFNRTRWWPLVGLHELHFIEDLDRKGLPRCGGMFDGICDASLIAQAFSDSVQPRTFAYVLSIDTHLPVQTAGGIPDDLLPLCHGAGVSSDVCTHLASLGRVLSRTAHLADALPPEKRPWVVVFGDHAPPFMSRAERLAFSQTHTPAYVLEPRP